MKTLDNYVSEAKAITRDYFNGHLTFDQAYRAVNDAGIVAGPAPWHSREFRGYVPDLGGMIAFDIEAGSIADFAA